MTDTPGEPLIQDTGKSLTCEDAGGNCNFPIGPLVWRQDVECVIVGGFPFYAIHGFCTRCGCPIHWTNMYEKLKRLTRPKKALYTPR